jgi:hypothetical protein
MPFADQPGALRVRPVQVGRVQETQRAAAEVDGVVGGHRDVFGRLLADGFNSALSIIWARLRQIDRACGARRSNSGRAPLWSGSRWLRTMVVISS